MDRKNASDFPQELLNLFDKYVHGDIERRDFLEGARKFATGGMTAMAIWESLRPNYAWAQQVAKDDSRIRTERATVPSPEGNGSVARRLGTENYMAFAPDGLTSAGGYPGDDERGAAAFGKVDRGKMAEDFVASARWLKTRSDCTGKIGVVGFCFGGGIANALTVRLGVDLSAAVPFYGGQPPGADVAKI